MGVCLLYCESPIAPYLPWWTPLNLDAEGMNKDETVVLSGRIRSMAEQFRVRMNIPASQSEGPIGRRNHLDTYARCSVCISVLLMHYDLRRGISTGRQIKA